jgi:hypothetical protein
MNKFDGWTLAIVAVAFVVGYSVVGAIVNKIKAGARRTLRDNKPGSVPPPVPPTVPPRDANASPVPPPTAGSASTPDDIRRRQEDSYRQWKDDQRKRGGA